MRAGKREKSGILSFIALPLLMKVLGKGVTRAGKGYNNMDHMNKIFQFCYIL